MSTSLQYEVEVADLTGYLSHICTPLVYLCHWCGSRSDEYMDVNVVKLLNNVRNWMYLTSRWENGVRILLDCCTVAVREGWNWDTTSLQVTCSLYSGFCCASSWLIESCRIMIDHQKETSCLLSSLWDEECRVHQ